MDKTAIKLLDKGENAAIYSFVDARGSDLSENYILSLNEKYQKKITALLQLMIARGSITNPEKFRPLDPSDKLYEFKSDVHRIPCFILEGLRPKSFILSHGFKKRKVKALSKEIKKAKAIKTKITDLYNNGKLKIDGKD